MGEMRRVLVEALPEQRDRQGRVQGLMTLGCVQNACPVEVIRVTVKETAARKPAQPPMKCPRCGSELSFVSGVREGWDEIR